MYKIKHRSKETNKSILLVTFENESLSDMSSAICLLLSIFGHSALITKVINTDLKELGQYPNYLFLYFLQHGGAFIFCFSMTLMHYVQKKNLRSTIWKKVKETFRLQ